MKSLNTEIHKAIERVVKEAFPCSCEYHFVSHHSYECAALYREAAYDACEAMLLELKKLVYGEE